MPFYSSLCFAIKQVAALMELAAGYVRIAPFAVISSVALDAVEITIWR